MNNKEFKRLIRLSPIANLKLYHLARFYMKRNSISAVLRKAGVSQEAASNMTSQMKRAMVKYRWDFDECIFYHYADLSDNERAAFVPEYEKNIFCDQVNDNEAAKIFDSKWASYCHFREFYKRECVLIDDEAQLKSFFNNHHDFILKPDSSACGRGIKLFHTKDGNEAYQRVTMYLGADRGRYIVEELIANEEIMSSLHPQSLNTVRIPTIRYDDRVDIIHPFLRIGRGNAVVDNAGAGGIMGNIDVATGVVYAASDEMGRDYKRHPETGVELIGLTIPKWQDALDLVKRMAQVIPSVRYVGWDMALTRNGWIMIEGNDKGQFVFQVADRKGFRDEFVKIRKELLG